MEKGRRKEEKMKREEKSESRVGCNMFASIHSSIYYAILLYLFYLILLFLIYSSSCIVFYFYFSFFLCCVDIWMLNILRSTPIALILSPADLFYIEQFTFKGNIYLSQ